jgi:hypothetical protein
MKNLVFLLLKKDPNLRPSIDEIFALDCVKEKIKIFQNKMSKEHQANTSNANNVLTHNTSNTNSYSISPINATISTINSNLNFTNFSQNSQINQMQNTVNQYSPINENDSSLFNFGYGNLLKQIVEVDNENSVSNSPRTIENKIRVNTIEKHHDNAGSYTNTNCNTQNQINSTNPRVHRYSPSYAVNDMSHIMKSLMQTDNNNQNENQNEDNYIILTSGEGHKNLSKFSKNQISVPEFREKQGIESPIKLTMEESKNKFYKLLKNFHF